MDTRVIIALVVIAAVFVLFNFLSRPRVRFGTIKRVGFSERGTFTRESVTLLIITLDDGSHFRGALLGKVREINEGDRIKYWTSFDSLVRVPVQRKEMDLHGVTSIWQEEIVYFAITSYVLNPAEIETPVPTH